MSQLRERSTRTIARPAPDEAVLSRHPQDRNLGLLRTIGAVAVLVVGAVHLEQYFGEHFDTVSVIGPLFLLNFAGAMVIGIGLLIPSARMRPVHRLLALGGIGLAATSIVFLFISEHQPLFGFQESGYRLAIVIALVAEGVAVVALAAYTAMARRRRA
jgi:hypothetical protein